MIEHEKNVLTSLDRLIYTEMKAVASEQRYPSQDPDAMDALISEGMKKAKSLRKIRELFEDTVTGIIWD